MRLTVSLKASVIRMESGAFAGYSATRNSKLLRIKSFSLAVSFAFLNSLKSLLNSCVIDSFMRSLHLAELYMQGVVQSECTVLYGPNAGSVSPPMDRRLTASHITRYDEAPLRGLRLCSRDSTGITSFVHHRLPLLRCHRALRRRILHGRFHHHGSYCEGAPPSGGLR